MGCMPAMEMMFRVRAPEVSRGLRPGDTIDFSLDGGDYVILDAKLVSRAQ
jgi:Cu/Ag efflux protein CusF